MKNIVITLFILIALSCKGQTLDAIAVNDFSLNNTLHFGDSPSQLTAIMGQPTNISTEYWEIEDETATVYQYLNAEFEFVNNGLVGFQINSNQNITLNTNLTSFQVGDSIWTLQSYYPNSYNSRSNGYMAINFGTGDYQYLLIQYDVNDVITSIERRIY